MADDEDDGDDQSVEYWRRRAQRLERQVAQNENRSTDAEIKAAKKRADIAAYKAKEAESNKKLRDATKKPSDADKELSHVKKERELIDERNKLAEAEHKHGELHPKAPFEYWVLGGMAVATVVVLGLALAFSPTEEPILEDVKEAFYQTLQALMALGITVAVGWGLISMVRKPKHKKEAAKPKAAAHH